MTLNFTFQDILGSLLAILIFPVVLLIPGYVLGWALNLFDFRERTRLVRYVIGITLSNAVVPIYVYLLYRFISGRFVIFTLVLYALIFIMLDILPLLRKEKPNSLIVHAETKRYQTILLGWAVIWIVFSVLLLVDLQFSNRLYFPTTSFDYTTRTAVIDAITRTGVPPITRVTFLATQSGLLFFTTTGTFCQVLLNSLAAHLITAIKH